MSQTVIHTINKTIWLVIKRLSKEQLKPFSKIRIEYNDKKIDVFFTFAKQINSPRALHANLHVKSRLVNFKNYGPQGKTIRFFLLNLVFPVDAGLILYFF